MIAFGICIGTREKFDRWAAPGIMRHAEPSSPIAEIDADSIFSGYNEALAAFSSEPSLEALVLLHEDVTIEDPQFCAKVRARLADDSIAVVGPIGATGVRNLCWWQGQMHGCVAETRGIIGHRVGCRDVEVVDGLLMVLSPWAVRNLRFDTETFHGWHAYDVDFCFEARAAGRRVVVDDLAVFHHAIGGVRNARDFWVADMALRHKWAERGVAMSSDAELPADARSALLDLSS